MNKDQILEYFRDEDIVYKEPPGFFNSTPNFYYDINKEIYSYPEILNGLADLIGEKLRGEEGCIAVSGYGGLALGGVIASKFNKKLVMVRKEKKKYGPQTLIHGYTPTKNDTVVIVDDVLATGRAMRQIIDTIQKTEAQISKVIFILELEKIKLPIPYESIFSVDEITKNTSLPNG